MIECLKLLGNKRIVLLMSVELVVLHKKLQYNPGIT